MQNSKRVNFHADICPCPGKEDKAFLQKYYIKWSKMYIGAYNKAYKKTTNTC